MHDILPTKQAKARGIIRSKARPKHHSIARPASAYRHTSHHATSAKKHEEPVTVTEEVTVTTTVTASITPMTRAIEHLSSEEKAEALRRARLQLEGVVTTQKASFLNDLSFEDLSETVTKTAHRLVRTTKRTLPKIKQLPLINQPLVQRYGLFVLAGFMVLMTGYVSIDTLLTNNNLRAQTSISSTDTGVAGASDDTNELTPTDAGQEGQDESDVSAQTIGQYTVAPDMPRVLSIPKIGVTARVVPMGVNADKSVQSPVNIFDSGWYTGSSKPGEDGAMFIDGHASGATRMGLLAYLDQLEKGDIVSIEKGDGSKLNYKVVHKETVPLKGLDMTKVLQPYGKADKALNLMTCTGTWIPDKQTYDHRVVIYTEQVS